MLTLLHPVMNASILVSVKMPRSKVLLKANFFCKTLDTIGSDCTKARIATCRVGPAVVHGF